jgi:hypothetical protein
MTNWPAGVESPRRARNGTLRQKDDGGGLDDLAQLTAPIEKKISLQDLHSPWPGRMFHLGEDDGGGCGIGRQWL